MPFTGPLGYYYREYIIKRSIPYKYVFQEYNNIKELYDSYIKDVQDWIK